MILISFHCFWFSSDVLPIKWFHCKHYQKFGVNAFCTLSVYSLLSTNLQRIRLQLGDKILRPSLVKWNKIGLTLIIIFHASSFEAPTITVQMYSAFWIEYAMLTTVAVALSLLSFFHPAQLRDSNVMLHRTAFVRRKKIVHTLRYLVSRENKNTKWMKL